MNDDKADNQQIKEEEKFSSRQGLLFTRDIDIERYKRLKLLSDIIVVSAVFTVLINLAWDSLIIVTTGVSLDREVIIPSVQDYPEPPLVFATLFLSLMAGDILGKSIIQAYNFNEVETPAEITEIETTTMISVIEEEEKEDEKNPIPQVRTWTDADIKFSHAILSHINQNRSEGHQNIPISKKLSLMIHGVETDWIEEEMADDDDFRKDVLEQKVKKALEEIGFSKKIVYKNLFRWTDGPVHAGVPPVVVIFKDKKDRVEVYNAAREGFKKSGWVVTEDSRSRLGDKKPKEISSKLNFSSFLDHYQSYPIAQQLFNKMIRLL